MLMKSIITSLSVSAVLLSATHAHANGEVHKNEKTNNDSKKVAQEQNEIFKLPASYDEDFLVNKSVNTTNNQNTLSEEDKLLLEELYGDVNARPFDNLEEPMQEDLSFVPKDDTNSKIYKWNKLKQYRYELPTSANTDYNRLVKEGQLDINYDKFNAFLAEHYPKDYVPVGPNDNIDNVKYEDYLMYESELENAVVSKNATSEQNNNSNSAENKKSKDIVSSSVASTQPTVKSTAQPTAKPTTKPNQLTVPSKPIDTPSQLTVSTNKVKDQQSTEPKAKTMHPVNTNNKAKDNSSTSSNAQQSSNTNKDGATSVTTNMKTDAQKNTMVKKSVSNKNSDDKPIQTGKTTETKVDHVSVKGEEKKADKPNAQQSVKSAQKKVQQLPNTGSSQSTVLLTVGSLFIAGVILLTPCLFRNRKSNV